MSSATEFRASLGRSIRPCRDSGQGETCIYAGRWHLVQLRQFATMGRRSLIFGGGAAKALRANGASVVCVDARQRRRTRPVGAPCRLGRALGSALALPFATGVADICLSSNVLEHVPQPERMAWPMAWYG